MHVLLKYIDNLPELYWVHAIPLTALSSLSNKNTEKRKKNGSMECQTVADGGLD